MALISSPLTDIASIVCLQGSEEVDKLALWNVEGFQKPRLLKEHKGHLMERRQRIIVFRV